MTHESNTTLRHQYFTKTPHWRVDLTQNVRERSPPPLREYLTNRYTTTTSSRKTTHPNPLPFPLIAPPVSNHDSYSFSLVLQVRECLLMSQALGILDDEEFVCLYDINSTKNSDFPYWRYEHFDLENMHDDECKAEFRFF